MKHVFERDGHLVICDLKVTPSFLFFQNFSTLQSTYRQSLCKLYDKDIKRFFDNAKFKISGNKLLTQTAGSSQVSLDLVL